MVATLAFCAFVILVASDNFHDLRQESANAIRKGLRSRSGDKMGHYFGGAVNPGYFLPENISSDKNKHHFAVITDLDKLSKMEDGMNWISHFIPGVLTYRSGRYEIEFEKRREIVTKHNEAGRGAEFSELTLYDNRLLTFDDRTGGVFEILNTQDGNGSFSVPRFIVTEGPGDTDKGMKWEWSTVKDDELYMGSMGKEFTRLDGTIVNRNNLWIGILNKNGELRREDWSDRYAVVRQSLNAGSPGYMIIEAMNWSPILHKWVFIPRRISQETYDDIADEKKGGNKIVLVNQDFTSTEVVTIKGMNPDPLRGFSSFAFVPNSKDRHVFAIRSVEEDCALEDESLCKQRSYVLVIDIISGEVLSDEIKIEGEFKFEGLEFVNIHVKPR